MARQNIDEEWKTDPRRKLLVKRLASERLADGVRVELNWLILDHRGKPIPIKKFKFIEDYEVMIECGLAEVDGDLVRIAGADRYNEWFEKQKENASRGGKAKAAKRKPKVPKSAEVCRVPAETCPDCPSISISSSFSNSNSNSNTSPKGANKSPTVGNPVVSAYYRFWQERYPGERPVVLPQHQKFLKSLGDQEGGDRAVRYVEAYLAMPDPWFVKKRHDVETLRQNLNAVSHFLATGKVLTKKVLEGIEDEVNKTQGTDRKRRRSIEDLEAEKAQQEVPLLTGSQP